jgi:hypothetical protein
MSESDKHLRVIHTQACTAVVKSDRTLTPADEAFWPLYLQAVFAAQYDCMTGAFCEVLAERWRHIDREGFTEDHDDTHDAGDLAAAASAYAQNAASQLNPVSMQPLDELPIMWPMSGGVEWWKPKDARRDLVRAASLIVAEIERIDRTTSVQGCSDTSGKSHNG